MSRALGERVAGRTLGAVREQLEEELRAAGFVDLSQPDVGAAVTTAFMASEYLVPK